MSSDAPADWFQRLFGFAEGRHAEAQSRLKVEGSQLTSKANGKSYGIGRIEVTSLQELRRQAQGSGGRGGMHVSIIQGDVRQLHRAPEFRGALFQVASPGTDIDVGV